MEIKGDLIIDKNVAVEVFDTALVKYAGYVFALLYRFCSFKALVYVVYRKKLGKLYFLQGCILVVNILTCLPLAIIEFYGSRALRDKLHPRWSLTFFAQFFGCSVATDYLCASLYNAVIQNMIPGKKLRYNKRMILTASILIFMDLFISISTGYGGDMIAIARYCSFLYVLLQIVVIIYLYEKMRGVVKMIRSISISDDDPMNILEKHLEILHSVFSFRSMAQYNSIFDHRIFIIFR